MLNIYAITVITATRSQPRCIKATDIAKRKWRQKRRTVLIDPVRL